MEFKEKRITFLILLAVFLLLAAFVLLMIWAFVFNMGRPEKANKSNEPKTAMLHQANTANNAQQEKYEATWNQLNQQLDVANSSADSIQANIEIKYNEFTQIRKDIAQILEDNRTPAQMEAAADKLLQLQQRLEEWRKKYNDVAAENIRLSNLLRQLTGNNKAAAIPASENATHSIASKAMAEESLTEGATTASAPAIQAQLVQLRAETEGDNAQIKGHLDVSSNFNNSSVEMYLVITQPDGKPLRQSGWNSGSFDTREGARIYSCKLRFDIDKGQNKTLNFTVPTHTIQKGTYHVLVYHKGQMIARSSKSLS